MTINRDELHEIDFSDIVEDEPLLPRVTPGDVLRLEFLEPLGLTAQALAKAANVPTNRITKIIRGERAITAETAILLGRELRTSAEFWMNLQSGHDLNEARTKMQTAA